MAVLRYRFAWWFQYLPWLFVAYAVLVLPWYFPPQQPVEAESYTFGFNNSVAQLGLAVGLALILALRLCDPRAVASDQSLKTAFRDPFTAPLPSKIWMGILIGLVIAAVGGFWLYIPSPYFGEATYFLPKLDLMLLGRIPYRDFDFGYGPLMLYGPCWLHWLSGGLIPIDSAYFVTLLLHYALGIAAIEFIVRCFALSEQWKLGVMAFAALASINPSMGVIYTPLRFVFAVWVAFFFHWKLQTGPRSAWFWALICPALGFGISPECGVVSFLAVMTAIGWRWREREFRLVLPVLACGGSLLATWLLFGSAYFAMIGKFGGGAFNFPILPTPYMIALLLIACVFLPRLAVAALRDKGPTSALFASLLISTGLFLPAAMGRCDPGHVMFNALGLLMVSTLLGGTAARASGKMLAPVGAFIILLTTHISVWSHYDARIGQTVAIRRAIAEDRESLWKADWEIRRRIRHEPAAQNLKWGKQLPLQDDLLELLRYPHLSAPLGCSEDIDRFLKLSGRDFPDYWVPANSGIFNQEALAARMAALSAAPYLLLPMSAARYLKPPNLESYAANYSAYLTPLFVFPVRLKMVHSPFSVEAEMVRTLARDYQVKGTFRKYLILGRDSSVGPAPSVAK